MIIIKNYQEKAIIDPKGTEHTDAFRKVDGFIDFAEKINNNENIIIKLFIKVNDVLDIIEKYRKYCFDDINNFVI